MLVTVLAALAGCGGNSDPPTLIEGRVVSLEYEDARLRSFTVDAGGERHELYITRDVSYGFDLDHLRQHREDGAPVRCDVEERGGRLVALTIEDA